MASEVQATANLALSKGQHRTVFRNPRGNKRYYAFYRGVSDLSVTYEWSSNGTTWTNSPVNVVVSVGGAVDAFDVKIRDDGSQLVVYVAIHMDSTTRYVRGTISDTSDTISWGSVQTIDASITDSLGGLHSIAIARTNNGRLVIAFTEDIHTKCKDYRQTKLIGSDGDGAAPTWSGETTWDDPSGNTNNQNKDQVWFGLENFGSTQGNRVLLYGKFPESSATSNYIWITAVPDWAGSSFSNTTQATIGSGATTLGEISAIVDASDFAHVVYAPTTCTHQKAGTAGDDDWGSATNVTTANTDAHTVALDTGPATDEIYVFYRDVADSQDFHYKSSPVDTISWGSEQTIEVGGIPTSTEVNEWGISGAATAHEALDDGSTNDGDSTYVTSSTSGDQFRVGGFGGVIGLIDVWGRRVGASSPSVTIYTYKNGTIVESFGSFTFTSLSYISATKTPTNPDFNEIRVVHDDNIECRISSVYVDGDITALTSWSRDIESGLHIGIEDADNDVHYHELDVSAGGTVSGVASISGSASVGAQGNVIYDTSGTASGTGAIGAQGNVILDTSAAISGAGTVVADAAIARNGAAAISGTGTVTAQGSVILDASAAISGTGTVTADGDTILDGSAAISGTGTVTAQGNVVLDTSAAISGTGTVGAQGNIIADTSAAINGTGSVSAAASVVKPGSAAIDGVGTVTAQGNVILDASAAISGTGTVTADAKLLVGASASISGVGTVGAQGSAIFDTSAAINGAGSVAGDADVVKSGSASISGAGSVGAQGNVIFDASTLASGVGTVAGDGNVIFGATATLSGTGTVGATGNAIYNAVASIDATGTVTAAGSVGLFGAASISGTGTLTADADVVKNGAATIAGVGSVGAQGNVVFDASASIIVSGTVTADGNVILDTSAAISGTGTLGADGKLLVGASAAINGIGTVTAAGTVLIEQVDGAATLSGVGTLTAQGNLILDTSGAINGTGTVTAAGSVITPAVDGAASISGTGTVTAQGNVIFDGAATVSGIGTLTGDGSGIFDGAASISGVGTVSASAAEAAEEERGPGGAPLVSPIRVDLEFEQLLQEDEEIIVLEA